MTESNYFAIFQQILACTPLQKSTGRSRVVNMNLVQLDTHQDNAMHSDIYGHLTKSIAFPYYLK